MVPVLGSGWSRGLNNVLRGELKGWFSTRRWWVQIIIWAACVNLILFIMALTTPKDQISMDTTLMLFNIFMGIAGPIGVSIRMQTVVVGEKRSGTAAWVLSKPVSRIAFILAKLIANSAGIAVTMVLAQGLIAYLIATFLLGFSLSISGIGRPLRQYPLLPDFDSDAGHDLRKYRPSDRHSISFPVRAEHLDVVLSGISTLHTLDACHPCKWRHLPFDRHELDGWNRCAILYAPLRCVDRDLRVC